MPSTKKIKFNINIAATKEKVWQILWNNETYKAWTGAFSEGSFAVSDWNEGSPIHFLDGKGKGMYSVIQKKVPNKLMEFKHIGEIKNNKEQPLDEMSSKWTGSLEAYLLKETNGITDLTVEMDIVEDFADYINNTFPKALQKVKEMAENKLMLTIEATVNAPIEKVWEYWTLPRHIIQWNNASPDWHTPNAENELNVGGKFSFRMEAKDGSMGFDFWGIYDDIKINELIAYTMGDGRKATNTFIAFNNQTTIITVFEAETENPLDMQQLGWQAILDNFKKYTEDN